MRSICGGLAAMLFVLLIDSASAQSPHLTPYDGSIGFNGSSFWAPPTDFAPYRPVTPNPFGPYDLLGGYARAAITAAQPTGYVITPTSHNGYAYTTTFGPSQPTEPTQTAAYLTQGSVPSATPIRVQTMPDPLTAAVAAFRAGQYQTAATLAESAVVADPRQGFAHLVESHAWFALGKYTASAAALRRALEVLPESQWNMLVDNYRDYYRATRYTQHLALLEQAVIERPTDEYAQLLLGYHAAALGQTTPAVEHLQAAVALMPSDTIATRLLAKLGVTPEAPSPAPANIEQPREF